MIVEYIRYKIDGTRKTEFIAAYTRAQSQLGASRHCLGYELCQCHEEPERFILRIEWDSIDGHLKGFRGSAEFKAFLAEIRVYIEDIEEMQHYVQTAVKSG